MMKTERGKSVVGIGVDQWRQKPFIRICQDRIVETNALGFFDIAHPPVVGIYVIHAQRQRLDIALVKFRLMRATSPSSVVQTGVKSLGWENSTMSPAQS